MRLFGAVALVIMFSSGAFAAEDVVSAVHGTVKKVDAGTKLIIVKTADGIDHSFAFSERTVVHGGKAYGEVAKASWHGLSKGSEVVVHYAARGSKALALEIDKVGRGGLKVARGTVAEIDRGTKKLVVATGDGAKESFQMTQHATQDAGKDLAKATAKGANVTVYYTEVAGKKIAHFFEGA